MSMFPKLIGSQSFSIKSHQKFFENWQVNFKFYKDAQRSQNSNLEKKRPGGFILPKYQDLLYNSVIKTMV